MFPYGGVSEIGQDADAISAQVFGKHFYVVVDVAVGGDFHVREDNVVDSQYAFVDFVW